VPWLRKVAARVNVELPNGINYKQDANYMKNRIEGKCNN
jgi:hypothetical protein